MRKFIVIFLSFIIVVLSFVACFADSGGQPIILPVGGVNDVTVGQVFHLPTGDRLYRSDVSPVYLVYYQLSGSDSVTQLVFSDQQGSHFYFNNVGAETGSARTINQEYNGYYYVSANQVVGNNVPIMVIDDSNVTSVTDVIDYIDKSVFSTTLDLTYLVNGSVSWLSTFAQAVKNNALLLFFVVFIFVGIGIGLLNRFRRG